MTRRPGPGRAGVEEVHPLHDVGRGRAGGTAARPCGARASPGSGRTSSAMSAAPGVMVASAKIGRMVVQLPESFARVAAGRSSSRWLPRPVDPVEPVARVVAVVLHRLAAQQVVAHVEERNALRRAAPRRSPEPSARTRSSMVRAGGHLVLHDVPEDLVVVRGDVVDRLLRDPWCSRALVAAVADGAGAGASSPVALTIRKCARLPAMPILIRSTRLVERVLGRRRRPSSARWGR